MTRLPARSDFRWKLPEETHRPDRLAMLVWIKVGYSPKFDHAFHSFHPHNPGFDPPKNGPNCQCPKQPLEAQAEQTSAFAMRFVVVRPVFAGDSVVDLI